MHKFEHDLPMKDHTLKNLRGAEPCEKSELPKKVNVEDLVKNQNTDERRKRFIADIAKTLVKNNSKMYVPDLASLLNLNEIKII